MTYSSIKKIRPKASIQWSYGDDGRDGRYYIEYRCPVCSRRINSYRSDNACDQCGTFYDWGKREPTIEITRSVKWDD